MVDKDFSKQARLAVKLISERRLEGYTTEKLDFNKTGTSKWKKLTELFWLLVSCDFTSTAPYCLNP
jgi:hypothetical protein